MAHPEQHYHWIWRLASPPAALWPLVSNTDRFNRDCGYPPVQAVSRATQEAQTNPSVRRLRTRVLGVPIEWDEYPFEWLAPVHFGVDRVYHRGPLARMIVRVELTPEPGGGTVLDYDIRVTPSGWLGRVAAPISIGTQAAKKMERVFRTYDRQAQLGRRAPVAKPKARLALGGGQRLVHACRRLVADAAQPAPLVAELQRLIKSGDDLDVARIRPYAAADAWQASRRETLQLFLQATRAGVVDFSWDLLCPHCRGARGGLETLADVSAEAHCDSCGLDFTANFDQSIELTFHPNPAIRAVTRPVYCVGGPQTTPHVIGQRHVAAGDSIRISVTLAPGRYRVRAARQSLQHAFRVETGRSGTIDLTLGHAEGGEPAVAPDATLLIRNATPAPLLAVIERLAWTDQAATAAEVTSLQLFRDLFAREVLRPGERIAAGTMTIVFTDLKDSTRLYREIGDAPAFGRVLTHFEILRAAVAEEEGCIVKTMGDAVMAVFPRPLAALRAVLRAQEWMRSPETFPIPTAARVTRESLAPLTLKAGIHRGPCLAITQNDRLDYFGTTVNVAARLCGQCSGGDVVASDTVCSDAEVRTYLAQLPPERQRSDRVRLKGFGDDEFAVRRISAFTSERPA